MRITAIGLLLCGMSACRPLPPPQPPTPPMPIVRTVVMTVRDASGAIVQAGSVTVSDDFSHVIDCTWGNDRATCDVTNVIQPGWQTYVRVFDVPQMDAYDMRIAQLPDEPTVDIGEIHLVATIIDPPLIDKTTVIRTAQENFGGIKLAGCGLHLDNLFDPFLLERWVNDRPCFERMMSEHAVRNDNMVSIDPNSGYSGFNTIDLWHDPATVTAFVRDIRRHRNAVGEPFRVRLFLGGDAHFPDMRAQGAWEHWQRDVSALAAMAAPYVDAVVPCWECRHDNSQASAKIFYDMLAFAGQQFPRAVHSVHLVAGSSAPSSWPCDPLIYCAPGDGPPANDADDPVRGNEPNSWVYMLDRGLADEFLYQMDFDRQFRDWQDYPPNPDALPTQDTRGALSRWWDIVVRLGDDPWSTGTACATPGYCERRGWRQVPVKAWEFIYDFYWNRDPKVDEAFLKDYCQHALALGGWGCGSASVRR